MTLWVLKGGRAGERERRMIEEAVLAVGWPELPDLASCTDREQLETVYRSTYPDSKDARVANHVGQLRDFLHAARDGELVLMPMKSGTAVAVGELAGGYAHREDLGPGLAHARPVRWLRSDVPREAFEQGLQESFDAFLTFLPAEGSEEQVREAVATAPPAAPAPVAAPPRRARSRDGSDRDLERASREMIRNAIERRFSGHQLVHLVEEILRARGFETRREEAGGEEARISASPGPGSLGACDLLALARSSHRPLDADAFREIRERLDSSGAGQGLVVCTAGFDETVQEESRRGRPQVQLWDGAALADAYCDLYERLPREIQTQVPLRRIWAPAPSRRPERFAHRG